MRIRGLGGVCVWKGRGVKEPRKQGRNMGKWRETMNRGRIERIGGKGRRGRSDRGGKGDNGGRGG
jgi:hypothetical protein